jgi:pyruvate/2-oxoglutarate dehydrogenase complex dihydrolipoamide dehydrogenase (E3) component
VEGVRLESDNGIMLKADELPVAAGRCPRSDDIGLETVDLTPGGYLTVGERLTVPPTPGCSRLGT